MLSPRFLDSWLAGSPVSNPFLHMYHVSITFPINSQQDSKTAFLNPLPKPAFYLSIHLTCFVISHFVNRSHSKYHLMFLVASYHKQYCMGHFWVSSCKHVEGVSGGKSYRTSVSQDLKKN